ncbi:MAG: Homoserine dehydrogenase [Planctomycetes bacterium]|nr:Homoserine dehydrogenase [Planctomycetota bacterium]
MPSVPSVAAGIPRPAVSASRAPAGEIDLASTSGASPPAGRPPFDAAPRTLRVALLGHGRVGRALCDLVSSRGDGLERAAGVRLRIVSVLVRDADRRRTGVPDGARVTGDAESVLAEPADVAVEALGGLEPAATLVDGFLARGTHVVTANKLLLAERGAALARTAAASGAALRCEASVAAGVPLFSVLERSLRTTRIASVAAVLNGTSNFVLSRIARGATFASALDEARRLGLAEADSSLDVRGSDAAHKLRVLSLALSGRELAARELDVRGIEGVRTADCARAAALGRRLRPVAWARLDGGSPHGWVAPAAVPETHSLASVEGAHSGVLLRGDTVEDVFLAGPGAGPVPTAASIVDDLVAIALGARGNPFPAAGSAEPGTRAARRPASRWLLSFAPAGRPSAEDVLAFLAGAGISFRQIRELDEPEGPVFAGLASECPPDAIERAGAGLRTVGAVREWTAFRAVDLRS